MINKFRQIQMCLSMVGLCFMLVACANPMNRATFYRYYQQGLAAENEGDWETAEIAYYRAAENVRWGNLGVELESDALFNLGRAKRKVHKLDESEELLKRALTLDEKRYGVDGFMTSYIIAELAATFYESKKIEEGVSMLTRLEPIALKHKNNYSEQARGFIKQLYKKFGAELIKNGKLQDANRFNETAELL